MVAPWAAAMALTMDRPRPWPWPSRRAGRGPSRSKGWNRRSTSVGNVVPSWSPTGQHQPPVVPVVTWMSPPGTLCRTALSISLAASCWIRSGSPSRMAGRRSAWTFRPRRPIPGRGTASAALVMAARSRGSCSPAPASLLARVSSDLMRRSCSALEASSCRLTACQVPAVLSWVGEGYLEQGAFPGQGRAQLVRGIGGEAPLGVERGLQPREQVVEGVGEFLELVVGSVQAQPLVQAAGGDPPGGGGDRAQRAQRPGRR